MTIGPGGANPSTREIASLLRGTRLFGGLDDAAINDLSKRARLRPYRRGDTIFLQDDSGDSLFAVASGLVKVYVTSLRGEDLVLATLGPGETFGEVSLLDAAGRSASAEAADACRLVIVDRSSFVEVLRSRPELFERLLLTLGSLVRRLTEQAGDLAFLDMHGRVAKLVLQLVGEAGVSDVEVPFSQSDLARMVGASRQTVNQILRSFQNAGYIEQSGRRVKILRYDALRQRAAD